MKAGYSCPSSGSKLKSNNWRSRQNTRPTFQVTPFASILRPRPRRPKISRLRLAMQMARLPVLTVSSSSTSTTGTPRCARSSARVSPTSPPPATTAG